MTEEQILYAKRDFKWPIVISLASILDWSDWIYCPVPRGQSVNCGEKYFFLETCENVVPVNLSREKDTIKTFWFSPSAGVSWSEVGPKKVSRISTDSNLSSSNIPSLREAPEQTGLVVKIVSGENKTAETFSRLFCCENSKITEDNLRFYHPQWCQVWVDKIFLKIFWRWVG